MGKQLIDGIVVAAGEKARLGIAWHTNQSNIPEVTTSTFAASKASGSGSGLLA